LPAGDEVDFLRFHIGCVYTFIVAVKARDERVTPAAISRVFKAACEAPGVSLLQKSLRCWRVEPEHC
jgi:hypothetical protein